MTTDKMSPKNIDEYIASFPKDIQEILEKIRTTVRKAAPDAEETVKYAMPTFTLKGNLVYFAAFKKHIGFYPPIAGPAAKGFIYLSAGSTDPLRLDQPDCNAAGERKSGKS